MRYLIFLSFIFLIVHPVFPQNQELAKAHYNLETRGEVYFSFLIEKSDLNELSKIISIDRRSGDTIFAFANRNGFDRFISRNISYRILTPPSLLLDKSLLPTGVITKAWNVYPTYDAYVNMMNNFAASYPTLCELHEIGTTVNGRKLLCVKISDYVSIKEAEPEFLFSSTMHGDEVTGYMLMLRLIDYLLTNYNTDSYVKELVDNIEIWINPNANPDGTYFSGNNTVSGATRGNANGIDLNRNFPDPAEGLHPDYEQWQPETQAMMEFMDSHRFVLSANYHGGAEVMNYPWDNFEHEHADNSWFEHISHRYADTVKKYGGSDYFSSVSEDGVINGYDWYPISGGRQDYTTYFCHGREITIEVSNTKMPPAASQPNFWNYNYRAMLNYISECMKGIHGTVTDNSTGKPLSAEIRIEGYDADNSQIYSDVENGNFHRLIAPGTYNIVVSADCYHEKEIDDVEVSDWNSMLNLDIKMDKMEFIPPDAPDLLIPSNDETEITLQTILRWYPVENAASYTLQIDDELSFESHGVEKIVTTDTFLIVYNLLPSTKYYWRVNTSDGCLYGDWSEIWNFTTGEGLSVNQEIRTGIALNQNFPNPFSTRTIIDFKVPYASEVTFEIYNINGKVINSFRKYFEAGTNYIEIETEGLPEGIYICRMYTGNFVSCIMMLKD